MVFRAPRARKPDRVILTSLLFFFEQDGHFGRIFGFSPRIPAILFRQASCWEVTVHEYGIMNKSIETFNVDVTRGFAFGEKVQSGAVVQILKLKNFFTL